MSSGSGLHPSKHAPFAVISRLISCLVTEQILKAFYIPITHSRAAGVLVVLSIHLMSEKPLIDRALRSNDIFALVPLLHPPVFSGVSVSKHGRPVGLVDPLDMFPEIYELARVVSGAAAENTLRQAILSCLVPAPWELGQFTALAVVSDPVYLWKKFVDGIVIQDSLRLTIERELQSSLDWQLLSYRSPPPCPSLASPSIEWEQSLVAGHPTHPMHRARMLSMSRPVLQYDWYHPRIRFVIVPRSSVDIQGPFEREIRSLVTKVVAMSGRALPDDPSSVWMPVHELQIPNILSKFHDVEILDSDISVKAYAQSSIRTVIVPELPGIALKLAVGVKISSSLRTISHFTADLGPRFSADIVPKLAVNSKILSIDCEPASAVYHSVDPEIAKHLTVVLRKEYQPGAGQSLIVCAALLEMDHAGVPAGVSAVEHACALDTEEKRVTFLDNYLRIACEALLPALIHNGVAFEAHAQNVLARFDIATGNLLGFVVRDIGGLRIHPPTLRQSTGVNFRFLPGHCVVTETLEETYPKFYHTFVHNHMQRLIRVLRLHHNGLGWEMLRRHMAAVIPADHPLQKMWLSPDNKVVPSKCLLRMRMRDSYRDMVYNQYPNMIQYRPEQKMAAE